MDYALLRTELLTNPVGITGGYTGLTAQAAADLLNSLTTGRTRNRTAVPVQEVFNAIDDGAWPAVSSLAESKLRGVLSMPVVDASNSDTRGIIGAIFPAAGVTLNTNTRLVALGSESISRATELGLGTVSAGDVALARLKTGGW